MESRTNSLGRARTGVFAFAGMFAAKVLNIVSGLIIAPAIGPAAYGIFVLARDLCNSFSLITRFGLDLGLVRFVAERKNDLSAVRGVAQISLLVVLLISSVFLGVVWGGGAEWMELNVYQHKDFALIFSLMAIMVPLLSIMKVFGAGFRGLLDIKTRVTGELIMQPLTRIVLVLFFFISSVSVWSVIWGTILSFLCVVIYFLWKAKDLMLGLAGTKWLKNRELVPLFKYAFVVSLTMSVALLLKKTDTLMLGYFRGVEDVGRYAIVQLAVPLIAIVNGAFSQRLAPEISRLVHAADNKGLHDSIRNHVRWMTISSVPIFVVFVFFGRDMLNIFGNDYVVDHEVIILLASAYFIQAAVSSVGFILSMTAEYRAELPLLLVSLLINFILNYILIPEYGLIGAAMATMIALIIANIMRIYVVYKIRDVWVLSIKLVPPVVFAFVLVYLVFLARNEIGDATVTGAFIAAGLTMVFYTAFMYVFGLNVHDRKIIQNLIARKI